MDLSFFTLHEVMRSLLEYLQNVFYIEDKKKHLELHLQNPNNLTLN